MKNVLSMSWEKLLREALFGMIDDDDGDASGAANGKVV